VPGKKPTQLVLDLPLEQRRFTLTRPLARHRYRRILLEKLHYVRRFFPELDGRTIRVGLTRTAAGLAVPGGCELWVNPSQTTHHSLAHEFIHLLQGRNDIPKGEKSCDVFALARHWTLNDSPPFYVRVPAEFQTTGAEMEPESARIVCAVARRALDMRKEGVRNYIAYFEKTLESLRPARERVSGALPERRRGRRAGRTDPPASALQMDELLAAPDADSFY
jgi:hypothetical protein